MKPMEYRVRPVIRYIVTGYGECASSVVGEFDNESSAELVAEALQNMPPRVLVPDPKWDAHIRMEREAQMARAEKDLATRIHQDGGLHQNASANAGY